LTRVGSMSAGLRQRRWWWVAGGGSVEIGEGGRELVGNGQGGGERRLWMAAGVYTAGRV
jgi:hypothetical protein